MPEEESDRTTIEEAFAAALAKLCPVCGEQPRYYCGPGTSIHIKRIWEDWE